MILLLLYALLCSYTLPVLLSLYYTYDATHPLVNASTLVLLTRGLHDPFQFWIVVHRTLSPGFNIPPLIQQVENFTATRTVSLVFRSAGPSSTRDADFSSLAPSVTVSSTARTTIVSASATSATPPKYEHKAAIVAGVVCGSVLLALIAAILLVWRRRQRRILPPEGAFPTNLENDRHHIIWPYLKRLSIPPLRGFFHDEREDMDHYPDVPPPPYSPLISST
ncbi:hypothetical protein IW261DRAFT_1574652 [Armillaria novae-zelandiae]|uniref:Uncharacterized protein n=1 Tax=Armillaria novae-zelandiae TaxID=153914 RepID=A0AA39NHN8_9AGAR|nr:hypothetical protein IW261DRAFT_1574652 [Armillaria novae-zelandiae]